MVGFEVMDVGRMRRWLVHDEVFWAREVVMEGRGGWWLLSLL